MSQKTERYIRKHGQKAFDRSARAAIMKYVDRVASQPLRARLRYAWRFIRGRNPHTNKKVGG